MHFHFRADYQTDTGEIQFIFALSGTLLRTVNGSADKMEILLKVLKDLSCLREQVERDSTRRRSVLWREAM